jgi:gliding motility-associated-like protein
VWNTDPAATTGSTTPPTPSTAVAGTTTYYVREVTGAGCISDPSAIHVTVYPAGGTTETVTICPAMLPYTWHGISVSAPGNGVASFKVPNQYGCDSIISLNLVTIPSAATSISKTNDIDCLTPSANLHVAGGGVSYSWEPADGLSNPAIADPVASPAVTTTYHVTMTNDSGCIDTASVIVHVTPRGSYLLPSAFTPNGDGHNDCFGIQRAARTVDNLEFSVFNRMGQMIFRTTNPGECWDGTFKGEPQPTGAYVYFIKGKGTCGVVDQKGTVMLVR